MIQKHERTSVLVIIAIILAKVGRLAIGLAINGEVAQRLKEALKNRGRVGFTMTDCGCGGRRLWRNC